MEFHVWFICGLMGVLILAIFGIVRVMDQRDAAIREAARWRELAVTKIDAALRQRRGQV